MTRFPHLKTRFSSYLPVALGVFTGCLLGFFLREILPGNPGHQHLKLRQNGWEYINPLLDCEQAQDTIEDRELIPFKENVQRFIQNDLNKKWADRISVYFRELNDGLSFRIGDTDQFHPASLLKVPLMMAVLRQAEADPRFLRKKIPYTTNLDIIRNTQTDPLVPGNSYSVEKLLTRMIRYSDNISTYLLDNSVDLDILERTYYDLGLTNPYHRFQKPSIVLASPDYMISTARYASFFRILFNASYLSKQMSEKALQLLSETDFRAGLTAGVPPGVKIAHKWGYHEAGENHEIKQLHDCGIIYYPEHPYLLCVMTSGNSYEFLDDAIREISRTVYSEIDCQSRNPAHSD